MPSLQTIFDTCRAPADVLSGTIRDEQFVADLARAAQAMAKAEKVADRSPRRLAFAKDVPPPPDLPAPFSLALKEE